MIDDNELNVTNIVRGFDLINSTFCQIHLQNILNHKTPSYSHIPIVIDQDGNKLSKQFGACGIENEAASKNLYNALVALCQEPPEELSNERLESIWDWAIVNWDMNKLSKQFGACGIENESASKNLYNALVALCQEPPEELSNERLDSIWDWAIVNWDISKLRMLSSLNHLEIT